MPPGKTKAVLNNELGQPLEKEGHKLSEWIGITVKHHCPLNYETWKRVPIGTKQHMGKIVQVSQ